jgi:hypothetical protein
LALDTPLPELARSFGGCVAVLARERRRRKKDDDSSLSAPGPQQQGSGARRWKNPIAGGQRQSLIRCRYVGSHALCTLAARAQNLPPSLTGSFSPQPCCVVGHEPPSPTNLCDGRILLAPFSPTATPRLGHFRLQSRTLLVPLVVGKWRRIGRQPYRAPPRRGEILPCQATLSCLARVPSY